MGGTLKGHRSRFSIPLSISIFTILISSIVIIAGALTIYGFLSARGAIREVGSGLLASASNATVTEIQRAIEPAAGLAELGALLPEVSSPPDLQMHPAGHYLMETLRTYPSLYSAYMGFADGRFYQIIDLDTEEGRARRIHDAPADAAFLRRSILPKANGQPMELWAFLNAEGRVVGSRALADTDFDPRVRPWYTAATTADHHVITPVYIFSSLGLPGLTVARRFDARIPGVFGIDLTVGELSDFLTNLEVTPNARLAVVSGDGTVVAMPGLPDILTQRWTRNHAEPSLGIKDIPDPALAEAAQRKVNGSTIERTQIDGEPFLLTGRHLGNDGGLDLRVVVAAPEADFVQPLISMRNRSLLFTALVLAIALPAAFFAARRMATALSALAEDARQIQQLDLAGKTEVRTFVREIQTLAKAMSMMKSSLRTFGLYVPKTQVRQIIEAGGEVVLGGKRHEVTLMFTDVTDFTTLAELVPPEELLDRTSQLFEEIDAAIRNRDGIIDKFIGDAVMAVWNAPQPVADHARLACLAALDARQRLEALNKRLSAKGIPPMITRFGVHTGLAVVGNVGCSDRINYTAVGAAVNMAARLEALNKTFGTQILVSGNTVVRAGDAFVFRWLDTVIPKGATESFRVFTLCGLASERDGLSAVGAEEADFIRRWNDAQALLRDQRDWPGAASAFADLAAERPDDPFAGSTAKMAADLVGRPSRAWNGITIMREK